MQNAQVIIRRGVSVVLTLLLGVFKRPVENEVLSKEYFLEPSYAQEVGASVLKVSSGKLHRDYDFSCLGVAITFRLSAWKIQVYAIAFDGRQLTKTYRYPNLSNKQMGKVLKLRIKQDLKVNQ